MVHLRYGVLAESSVKEEHVVFAIWRAQVGRDHPGPKRKLPSQVVAGSRQREAQFVLFPVSVFKVNYQLVLPRVYSVLSKK